MRTILIAVLLLLGALLAQAESNLPLGTLPNGDNYIANRIIVAIEYGGPNLTADRTIDGIAYSGVGSIENLCKEIGVTHIEPFYRGRLTKPALVREVSRLYVFTLVDGIDATEVISRLENESSIDYASLYMLPTLHYVPNDPRAVDQWFLPHTQAYEGWDIVRGDTTRHSIIAIVDTGVNWDHPDLAPNIWINAAEDANQNGVFDSADNDGVDADSNGFVDDVVGWDFGDDDNQPRDSEVPHGTPVAGTASEATDNGLLGAAIGFSARIMCIKGFSGGLPMNAYQGMIYAAETGAEVVNCSWGTMTFNQAEQDMINAAWEAGALIIGSAGALSDTTRNYPAAYQHVMAVAATDRNDHKASFSGYGTWVDICAPGVDIWTIYGVSDFIEYSGTSFSTAMVSGLAALIRAWHPNLNNDEVEQLIEASADTIYHLNPNLRGLLGAGRINCYNWISTGIDDNVEIPGRLALMQNYPNPFNATTVIRYELPAKGEVTLDIFNILGERVARIPIGTQSAGNYDLSWNAGPLPSGMYFSRLQVGNDVCSMKMILLK